MTENEIKQIIVRVLEKYENAGASQGDKNSVPLEVSARHVHLTREAADALFGEGTELVAKRALSQPGEFLAEQRVKLVTPKGEIANVAVLGPFRGKVQAELSLTDCRALGINAPVNLSGCLDGAADVLLVGERGFYEAKGAVIAARAHIHLTPEAAEQYGVRDAQRVKVRVESERPLIFCDIPVRVSEHFAPALHIDFDEANACAANADARAFIITD